MTGKEQAKKRDTSQSTLENRCDCMKHHQDMHLLVSPVPKFENLGILCWLPT